MPIDFFDTGNSSLAIKELRVGRIMAVDTMRATAVVSWVSNAGQIEGVPLCMPFMGPGWGVMAMPTKGTIVLIGMRPDNFPVIISYFPPSLFTPDSYYSRMIQEYGMFEASTKLEEGELYLRSRFSFSKCDACGKFSSNTEFQSTISKDKPIEVCPKCGMAAVVYDQTGRINRVFKRHIGSSLHLKNSGEIIFQQADTLGRDLGDANVVSYDAATSPVGLLKMAIRADSAVIISEAKSIDIGVVNNFNIVANNISLTSKGTLIEKYLTKSSVCNGLVSESYGASALKIRDAWSLDASSAYIKTSLDCNVKCGGFHVEGEHDFSISSDSGLISVSGNFENYSGGSMSSGSIGNALAYSASKQSAPVKITTITALFDGVAGNYGIFADKNFVVNAGGKVNLTSVGEAKILSSGNVLVNGTGVTLNSGTKGVARQDDAVLADSTTTAGDAPSILTFIQTLQQAIAGWTPVPNDGGAALKMALTAWLAMQAPSKITGKITGGSSTVKAG